MLHHFSPLPLTLHIQISLGKIRLTALMPQQPRRSASGAAAPREGQQAVDPRMRPCWLHARRALLLGPGFPPAIQYRLNSMQVGTFNVGNGSQHLTRQQLAVARSGSNFLSEHQMPLLSKFVTEISSGTRGSPR